MNVLISIKKPYSDKILAREKKWEFRKRVPKADNHRNYYIFECGKGSCHAITGMFTTSGHSRTCRLEPGTETAYYAETGGVEESDLVNYLPCYAIGIWIATRFSKPIPLSEIGISHPPQSWQYLTPEQTKLLKSKIEKAIGQ